MDGIYISDQTATRIVIDREVDSSQHRNGFYWIDVVREDVERDPEQWRDQIEHLTGAHLFEPHLRDAVNPYHPSYFEPTPDYGMLVFRKLSPTTAAALRMDQLNVTGPNNFQPPPGSESTHPITDELFSNLQTQPVTFFVLERALITVREAHCPSIDSARNRLMEHQSNGTGKTVHTGRLPISPQDLLLRILNGMVDQYLALRAPLTEQLDQWQHALLDPKRPFKNWLALLDARLEIRKLESLCEEQHDAVSELRDYLVDSIDVEQNSRSKDLLLVRANDVMEHISRVLNHARRMEGSIESAVQIHFSAVSHRTNQIMRTLTVITALFMPLTLITGIFGMNFEVMPLLKDRTGFWTTMFSMGFIVIAMLIYFKRRSYLEDNAMERMSHRSKRR